MWYREDKLWMWVALSHWLVSRTEQSEGKGEGRVSASICLPPLVDAFRCDQAVSPAHCFSLKQVLPLCLHHVFRQCAFPGVIDYSMCQNKSLHLSKGLSSPRLATSSMTFWSFCFCVVPGIELRASCMLGEHSNRAATPAEHFFSWSCHSHIWCVILNSVWP